MTKFYSSIDIKFDVNVVKNSKCAYFIIYFDKSKCKFYARPRSRDVCYVFITCLINLKKGSFKNCLHTMRELMLIQCLKKSRNVPIFIYFKLAKCKFSYMAGLENSYIVILDTFGTKSIYLEHGAFEHGVYIFRGLTSNLKL